jgi:hypothetical protein
MSYYYLILALQAFCLFHAYKNDQLSKWLWLIVFIPVIGCAIYLFANFKTNQDIGTITEGVKGFVYSNYAVEKLEKEVKYSETMTNKMNLADAYTERSRYDEAIQLYESCRKGAYVNSPEVLRKLVQAYFLKKEYAKTVEIGQILEPIKSLGDSEDKIAYAWSLHLTGNSEKSEEEFKKLDAKFANFHARCEFARFMVSTNRPEAAQTILKTIIEEHEGMDSYEKKLKKDTAREAKRLLQSIKV